MYPRVKVKQQKEDEQYGYESLPSLKALESLSICDFSSSDDSPTSVAKIPRACFLSPDRHGLRSSTGRSSDDKKNMPGGSKTNARAASVPRPRAVVSSPDNDQIVRMRSRAKTGLIAGLKSRVSHQNRHTKCKAENPTNGNKGSKEKVEWKT